MIINRGGRFFGSARFINGGNMNELIQQQLQELAILKINNEAEGRIIASLLLVIETNKTLTPVSAAIRSLARIRGFQVVGEFGAVVPYDHNIHRCFRPVNQGDPVRVTCLGVARNVNGGVHALEHAIVSTDINAPEWAAIDAERAEAKRKAEAAEAEKWEKARAEEASRWKRYD